MRSTNRGRALALFCAVSAVTMAACGGSSASDSSDNDTKDTVDKTEVDTTVEKATTTEAPATTEAASAGGLDAVAAATIQIEAQGTFVDPEFGAYEGAGRGSGFIVDPSGIAVTNNHVVGGAGLLKVFVPGEERPRNAKVLGVSECSDLAVIDIDGEDLPYLQWYDGAVQPGLDIYAAGYPLGDPEYTLTRGIVAKAEADGETQWASVDHVIEHDAAIQPGNSGGPLVTEDGAIVGINYAGAPGPQGTQYFAIEAADAQPIIEQLEAGEDVNSLGINGQIVASEDGTISGLWVSAVKSGSPADLTGISPGDIITRLEGVSVGTDGTMADYCDVMRTHNAGDALSVEVLRYATEEVLTGQFNGEVLSTAFSFADTLDDTTTDGTAYGDYVTITDDSGALTVSVPAEWTDVDGAPVDVGGVSSPSIKASTDIAGFDGTWTTPGMQFVASDALAGYTADDLLDLAAPDSCSTLGRDEYDDGFFAGRFETFENCGGSSSSIVVVAAFPEDASYGVMVVVQVVSDADLEALDTILRSFYVS